MLKWALIIIVLVLVGLVMAVVSMQASTRWQRGEVLRTPERRFENLPGYAFTPHYEEVLGYRVHYVDEGPRDGVPILLMHGQPSWSYLYRHMIPALADAGYRVIAPDLVGFGKSDKPTRTRDHAYQMHIDVMSAFVRQLDLDDTTLFAQDWGGLIGLRVVAQEQDRFARVMISNTGLPAAGGVQGWLAYPLFKLAVAREGKVTEFDISDEDFSFFTWVSYARNADPFDFAALFQSATATELTEAELAAYAAPFPDRSYTAAVQIFPSLVPSQMRQNQRVMREVFAKWDKPFLTAFGDQDPVTAGGEKVWIDTVPGATGQPHEIVKGGAHFIQEDQPDELVQRLLRFIRETS